MGICRTIIIALISGLIFGVLTSCASGQIDYDYREEAIRMVQKEYQDVKGIRIGQAGSLKAMISQQGQYDSNIFLTSNNKKHDYISITSPKFLLDAPIGRDARHLLQLMYKADAATFSDFKIRNYVNQDVLAKINLSLPFGYLNVQDNFRDTVDRASTEFTSQMRRNENLAQTIFGVTINKLAYEVGYSYFLRNYHDNEFDTLNYSEAVYSGTVFYQVFPKTKALLEYDYGVIKYVNDELRNGDYGQIRAGFKVDLTGKTEGMVKLGYQQRNYDTEGRSGFSGFVAGAGINTIFSKKTMLGLNFISNAVESISSNNNYFDLNSVGAILTQKIMGNFTLLLSTQFSRREYPEVDPTANVKRRDSVLSEGITLQYQVKNFGRINLGYHYTTDISNIDSNEYNDNLISLWFDFLI
jgi:hypothetical protein